MPGAAAEAATTTEATIGIGVKRVDGAAATFAQESDVLARPAGPLPSQPHLRRRWQPAARGKDHDADFIDLEDPVPENSPHIFYPNRPGDGHG